jgi:hypothetical protein
MLMRVSAVQITTFPEEHHARGWRNGAGSPEAMAPLAVRVQREYMEMPGLRLTVRQAARLFGVPPDVAGAVLDELRRRSILACSDDGAYSFFAESSHLRT